MFSKETVGDFHSVVKYIINEQHSFDITVIAKSVPVCIESDRVNLKFTFDEQSLSMTTKETVKLTNPGKS